MHINCISRLVIHTNEKIGESSLFPLVQGALAGFDGQVVVHSEKQLFSTSLTGVYNDT